MVKLKLWQGAEVLSGREYNFDLGIYNKINIYKLLKNIENSKNLYYDLKYQN